MTATAWADGPGSSTLGIRTEIPAFVTTLNVSEAERGTGFVLLGKGDDDQVAAFAARRRDDRFAEPGVDHVLRIARHAERARRGFGLGKQFRRLTGEGVCSLNRALWIRANGRAGTGPPQRGRK